MKNKTVICAVALLGLCFVVDGLCLQKGGHLLGVNMFASSIIIFFAACVWHLRRAEEHAFLAKTHLILPTAILSGGLWKLFDKFKEMEAPMPDPLVETGQIFLSRYQTLVWIMGLTFLVFFLGASFLLQRGKT